MAKRTWNWKTTLVLALTLVSLLGRETLCAQVERTSTNQSQTPEHHSLRLVDFFNLFPNVGAFLVWAEPNDAGFPEGLLGRCTATLVHERALLTAGHCTAPAATGELPFIKFYVTFSPNALDRSSWRAVSGQVAHPSLPPCPPPDLCTFRGLDPGILDIGLVFLSEPARHIPLSALTRPNTLERNRATVDNEWASWSLPGVVCFGDSGAPTFIYYPSTGRKDAHIVAVASDGGDVCFSRDDRARVDTDAARDWVRRTIAQTISRQ